MLIDNKKMKITHIVYSYLGGPLSLVNSFLNQKNSRDQESAIYVGPNLNAAVKKNKKISPESIYYVKTIRFLSIFYFYKVFLKLIKLKPDIIVLHNYQIIPCILFKIFFFTKIIYVDHYGLSTKPYKDRLILELSKFFVEHYVVLNQDNFDYLNTRLRINKNKIIIISNGIDLEFYKTVKKESDKKILKVGMAARFNSTRHHKLIVEAINSSILKDIKIQCNFAGEGELKNELKKITKKRALNKKFLFNNMLNQYQLKKWYSNLDLYIQATKGEGMSISLIQAMAMGVPVLASNVTGIKNFLNPKKFIGLVFENDKTSLAKQIRQFFLMRYRAKKKISTKQIHYVKNNFSEVGMIKKYNELYKKIT